MKRLGLVVLAVLLYALAPVENLRNMSGVSAQVQGTDCLLQCYDFPYTCEKNEHFAYWFENALAMYGEGAHQSEDCFPGACVVKHPGCTPIEQEQLTELFNTLQQTIDSENARKLDRLLRRNAFLKVNVNRNAIQVKACTGNRIIGHMFCSGALIQSLQQ